MTIRKRLFLSNILMILLPLFLSLVLVGSLAMTIAGIINIGQDPAFKDKNRHYLATEQSASFMVDYSVHGDIAILIQDIDIFNNSQNSHSSLSMALLQGGQLVFPETLPFEPSSFQIDVMGSGSNIVNGETAIYILKDGDITLLLMDTSYLPYQQSITQTSYMVRFSSVIIAIFIATILLTNTMLTRAMTRSIMGALDVLVYGVNQIRDGNLTYRIKYSRKDEFAQVANDFNEMAGHLQEMVDARLQDNENRKELVAGISHDLRTPLTSVRAYVEGLETGVASTPEAQRKYLAIIKSKTGDIEHIVSQLFLFSKLDVGDFPFAMDTVILDKELPQFCERAKEDYAQRGLELCLDIDAQDLVVKLDTVQFRNSLTNLLENSVKYGRQNGCKVNMHLAREGESAVVTLEDNGNGVAPEAIGRLFDVFYRADAARREPGKGSGLGLAITAKIIERFGGKISATNAPQGGLCVRICLPLAEGEK